MELTCPEDEKQRYEVTRARDAASRASFVPKRLGTSARNDPYAHDRLYFRSVETLTTSINARVSLLCSLLGKQQIARREFCLSDVGLTNFHAWPSEAGKRKFWDLNWNLRRPEPMHAVWRRLHREQVGLTSSHYGQ